MDKISEIIDERARNGLDDPFYVLSREDVREKWRKWVQYLPRVTPFYAMKCNDNESVVKTLAELGAGFDCTSKSEIAQVLNYGIDKERIVYAHPSKPLSHLKFAANQGIKKITFDCIEELEKIKAHHPKAEVVLRIRFDADDSFINLGIKFGCDPDTETIDFIRACNEMKMNLVGISFHVGSGTVNYEIFEQAIAKAHELFDQAKAFGFDFNFLDIGGGFMGYDPENLKQHAASINRGIEKYFPDPKIAIISEPGSYFVDTAIKVAIQVVLKKNGIDGQVHYYMNDGIYMSFLMRFLYEMKLSFDVIRKTSKIETNKKLSTLWGCTCNSKDKIIGDIMVEELEIGDWIVFHNMGDYTNTAATSFNGFSLGDFIVID